MSNVRSPLDALGLVGNSIDGVRFDACVDEGGFALIYRGHHTRVGKAVAVKCLRISEIHETSEEMREALAAGFRDETALLYRRLSQGNPDIVPCISSGTLIAPATKERTPYLILDWLEGSTLSSDLQERREQKLLPRSLEAAIELLDTAVGALAYAHGHDIVHRDVRPRNLFLARTGAGVRMKVLDFGLAKILSDEPLGAPPSVRTAVGVHFCSPSYGAPEQFSAQLGKIGPATDVYSLVLVLLEVMTGEKVRPADTLAAGLLKAIDVKACSPSATSLGLHVPKAVEDLLLRAVARDPLERPRDLAAFWSAVKDASVTAPRRSLSAATVMDENVSPALEEVRAEVRAAVRESEKPAPLTGTVLLPGAPALKATMPIGATSPLAAPRAQQHAGGGVASGSRGSAAPPPNAVYRSDPPPPNPAYGSRPPTPNPAHGSRPPPPQRAHGSGPPPPHPAHGSGPPPPHPAHGSAYGSGPPPPNVARSDAPAAHAEPLTRRGSGASSEAPGEHDASVERRVGGGSSDDEPVVPKSGSGGLIALVVLLVLAVAGAAFFTFR